MPFSLTALRTLLALIGTPYERLRCYALVQHAYRTQGVELPSDYYAALRFFRTLAPGEEPEPWDLVVIRNHKIVTNHVGLYLGDGEFLHSLEDAGVIVSRTSRIPWCKPGRIAGYLRLRPTAR